LGLFDSCRGYSAIAENERKCDVTLGLSRVLSFGAWSVLRRFLRLICAAFLDG